MHMTKPLFSKPALLAATGLLLAAAPASAVIVYSGTVDIPIPVTFAGVYLDIAATPITPPPVSGPDVVTTDSYEPASARQPVPGT
jgi:hypothetical protein